MRVGFISDLHIDNHPSYRSQSVFLELLGQVVERAELECLIIGGDIANRYERTLCFVEAAQQHYQLPVYFVPGNHDYWMENPKDASSWDIHQIFKDHPQCLIGRPFRLNDQYGIVGHSLWYNHAYYDKDRFTADQIERGVFKGGIWQDKNYVDFGLKDRDVSQLFLEELEVDLQTLDSEEVIVVSHIVTTPRYIVPMPHRIFDFFNAFIATDDLESLLEAYPISKQVMGHVHFRSIFRQGQHELIVNSLGYQREWRTAEKKLEDELADALVVMNLS